MIPAPILAALAPVVADYVTGKSRRKDGEEPSVLETAVDAMFSHEKKKASIRPLMMKLTGWTAVLVALAGLVAAMSPLVGYMIDKPVPQDMADAAVSNLLMVFGGTGAGYLGMHGARSVEKSKGAA